MSNQKSILTFFQKQTPVKRLLETSSMTSSTNSATDSNKENAELPAEACFKKHFI